MKTATAQQWHYEYPKGFARPGRAPEAPLSVLRQWEYEQGPAWRRLSLWATTVMRRRARALVVAAGTFLLGAWLASGPDSALANLELRHRLDRLEAALKARQSELVLTQLELTRLKTVTERSARYRIPADLSAAIYDIALAEGIDPNVAFALIRVESEFTPTAVSPKGAVGLTQVMPTTAYELNPTLAYNDLFERETNLRLGFRYLRLLLDRYSGDLRLALLAYNRGPGTVDGIRSAGGDPGNGYARAVIRAGQ